VLKLCTRVVSATFLFALMLASEANAESRLPPCPKDRSVSWDNCHGTLTLSDGVEYVGEFKDANLNGQGTYTWPNGEKYVGEIRDGELNGQGTLTLPDGRKYVGEFKDGKTNGQGTQTWPDGVQYVGEFKDGEPNGQGTYTFPDGDKYVGEIRYNKRNGYGTLYSSNGSVRQSGIWRDDSLVEPPAENSSNKAITSAFGLPEKTDGYLPLILLAIAAITAIAAIFLMKDRAAPSVRVSSPTPPTKVPATELEGANRATKTHEQNRTTTNNVALLEKLHDGFLKLAYQEKVLYVAASVIALMLIFPPTLEIHMNYPYSRYSTNSYDFIFSLPNNTSVNIQVILIQLLVVCLVAAMLYFVASKKKNKSI